MMPNMLCFQVNVTGFRGNSGILRPQNLRISKPWFQSSTTFFLCPITVNVAVCHSKLGYILSSKNVPKKSGKFPTNLKISGENVRISQRKIPARHKKMMHLVDRQKPIRNVNLNLLEKISTRILTTWLLAMQATYLVRLRAGSYTP